MSEDRIARYLERYAAALRARDALDALVLEEARGHLLDAVDAGLARGLSRDEAEHAAMARFGDPHVVAAHAGSMPGIDRLRLLHGVCAFTMLATLYLSASLILLHPPRAHYGNWIVQAVLFMTQGGLTVRFLSRGCAPLPPVRRLLMASSILVIALGAWSLHTVTTGRFEGYAVVVGTALCIQGVLTLTELRRWTGFAGGAATS